MGSNLKAPPLIFPVHLDRSLALRAAWLTARRAGLRRVLRRLERRLRLGVMDPWLAPRFYPAPAGTAAGPALPTQLAVLRCLVALRGATPLAAAWDALTGTIALLGQPPAPLAWPASWLASPVADPLWAFRLHSWEWAWPHLADPARRTALLELWRDWLARVPVGRGPAWEPHPTSQRLVVWAAAWHLLGGDATLAAAIARQAAFLADHLERDLDNNHLVTNAKALAWAGVLLPGLPGAPRWRRQGLELFWTTLDAQVLADGGHDERSTGYHLAVWLDALELALLCLASGEAPPPRAWAALERMRVFALALRRPDGRLPLLNDSVEDEPLPASAIFALAEVLLGVPGHAAGRCRPVTELRDSGYAVLRAGAGPAGVYLAFDAGELGPRHFLGHGHADALSFELWAGGEPLVLDPGTYQYPAGPWRDYFRGTAAHSTVTVDGYDQSVFAGPFRVAEAAHGRIVAVSEDAGAPTVTGEHDGYRRLASPVSHRRSVQLHGPSRLTLADQLEGAGRHALVGRLHLAPCQLAIESPQLARAIYPGGSRVAYRLVGDAAAWRVEEGWTSRRWYQREPSPVLAWAVETPLPFALVTEIAIEP